MGRVENTDGVGFSSNEPNGYKLARYEMHMISQFVENFFCLSKYFFCIQLSPLASVVNSIDLTGNCQKQTIKLYSMEIKIFSATQILREINFRDSHACALELHTVFGFLSTPGVQPQVIF